MLEPGQLIGKYVVEALVGEGGLARVYRVRHTTLDTAYALKLLAIRGGSVHRRLVREGRIQAALDHPHVVSVLDVIEHDGHPGLVMEYIEGRSLDRLLGAVGALPIDAALALSAQILGAIQAAHDRGVLHRDLKPANVMLQPVSGGARAAVTDFGIARLMAATGGDTLQGDFLGTPGFMAPEQVSDPTSVDPRADIYSLGAVVYCMVCGRPPFLLGASLVDTLRAAEHAAFPAVLDLRADCPPHVAEAIEAALAADPAQRPATVADFGQRLFGDAPDLMRVVGGQAGTVALRLPGPFLDPESSSLQPITPAGMRSSPTTGGTSSGGGADTAVPELFSGPETFDLHAEGGGAATAVPELFDGPQTPSEAVAEAPAVQPTPAQPPPSTTTPPAAPTEAPAREDEEPPVAPPERSTGTVALIGLGIAAALGAFWLATSPSSEPTDPPADRVAAAAPSPAPPAPAVEPSPTPAEPPAEPSPAEPTPTTPPSPPTRTPPAPTAEAPPPVPGSTTPPPTASPPPVPASADAAPEPVEPPPNAPTEPTEEPAAEAPAPADTDPPAGGDATADAGPLEPDPEPAPPPETAPPPMPDVTGTWKGKYGGRPLTLTIQGQQGERVSGSFDVLAGPSTWKTIVLSGRVQADGSIVLSDSQTGWSLAGRAVDNALTGTIQHPDLRKPMALRASRR